MRVKTNIPVERPRHGSADMWTPEKIAALSTPDLRALHANAIRLGEEQLAEDCDAALGARPRGRLVERKAPRRKEARGLVSRSAALATRGVVASNRAWSRGAVRASDGAVVLMLWSGDVVTAESRSACRLWAPNVDGASPWSDSSGGRERLQHCVLALERGSAEAMLAYGVALDGVSPDAKVLHLDGVDPDNVLRISVEQRGEEFWAVWGPSARGISGPMPDGQVVPSQGIPAIA